MLFTREQLKHLQVDGEETYRFVGGKEATEEEKKRLLETDESYVDLFGFHMITNYEDLK